MIFLLIFFNLKEEVGAQTEIFIKVNISERKMFVIKNDTILKVYPVAVPRDNYYPLPLKGKIVGAILNPWWFPTEKTRIDYFKKKKILLPKAVPPGPHNPMGKVKFLLQTNFREPIRIHGTDQPGSIGKKITRGCIRLKNEDALELYEFLKDKFPVDFEITF